MQRKKETKKDAVRETPQKEKKKKSWFAEGQEGIAKSKQEDEVAKLRRENKAPWRFRLDSNEEAKITFLDSPKFFFREHNLQIGGRYGNFFTCLQDFDTCPIDSMDQSSYVLAGTIIDHRELVDGKGVVYKNQKRLFVAKGKARENLVRQLDKKGELQYCVYEISRGSSPTECGTGKTMEFQKQLTRKQLEGFIPKDFKPKKKESWLDPYDYSSIFAPKPPEELRKILGQAPPVGSAEESSVEEEEKSSKDVDSIEDLL